MQSYPYFHPSKSIVVSESTSVENCIVRPVPVVLDLAWESQGTILRQVCEFFLHSDPWPIWQLMAIWTGWLLFFCSTGVAGIDFKIGTYEIVVEKKERGMEWRRGREVGNSPESCFLGGQVMRKWRFSTWRHSLVGKEHPHLGKLLYLTMLSSSLWFMEGLFVLALEDFSTLIYLNCQCFLSVASVASPSS